MSEWQKHDGMGYPVPIGTKVAYRLEDGECGEVTIEGKYSELCYYVMGSTVHWSSWHWEKLPYWVREIVRQHRRIIAYRIIDDGEESKREARSELFKKMIEGVAPVGGEPKLPAPKKKVKVSG